MRAISYLTDVEGRWDKLVDFCADNPHVRLDDAGALSVADGAVFVFGGDVCDRGPASGRLVATFLAARRAQPDRVVLLAGNRDLNKIRLRTELDGHRDRAERLRYLLAETMGARRAFEHRRAELAASGQPASDDDVVDRYLADVAPDGPLVDADRGGLEHVLTNLVDNAIKSSPVGSGGGVRARRRLRGRAPRRKGGD
jgi:hypothetical protein